MTYDFAPLFRTAIGFDRLARLVDTLPQDASANVVLLRVGPGRKLPEHGEYRERVRANSRRLAPCRAMA